MRSGLVVELSGTFGREFEELMQLLAARGVECVQPGASTGAPVAVRLMALRGLPSLAELQRRQEILRSDDIATVAVLPRNDTAEVAMAAAIDCDDVLIWPVGEAELARRLENLRNLTRQRREWRLRQAVIAKLVPSSTPARAWPVQRKLAVLLVGPIGSAGGRIAEMIQPAQVVFAATAQAAASHLAKSDYDLVFADLCMAGGPWVDIDLLPHTMRAWIADPAHDRLRRRAHAPPDRWFDDLLPADLASDLLRARLRILRRLATIGRELGQVGDGAAHAAIVDGETRCWNGSFARAYLAMRQDGKRVFNTIDLAPPDIGALVGELGFAGLGAWLAGIAGELHRHLRCDDLLCHLGDGRFRIVLQECGPIAATLVAERLVAVSEGRLQLQTGNRSRRIGDLQPASA